MKDIVIYGAGGFGREIACLLRLINEQKPEWNLIGFLDDNEALYGTSIDYGPVLGGMEWLNSYPKPLSAVIAIGVPQAVKSIADRVSNPNVDFPNIFAPSVIFLDRSSLNIGKGNIFCSNCLISCNVKIGNFNLFNGFIPVGHDAKVGNYNIIMPSSIISGGVEMGECNFMGLQSAVSQYIRIGNNTRIGANSFVMRNTKDGFLYIGNPAKRMDI